MLSKELDDEYEKYKINISSAEAQKELIDIGVLSAGNRKAHHSESHGKQQFDIRE